MAGRHLSWLTVSRSVRLALGVALIVNEGIIRPTAQLDVLATGIGLLGLPDVVRFDRWLSKAQQASNDDELVQ